MEELIAPLTMENILKNTDLTDEEILENVLREILCDDTGEDLWFYKGAIWIADNDEEKLTKIKRTIVFDMENYIEDSELSVEEAWALFGNSKPTNYETFSVKKTENAKIFLG